MLPPTDDSHPHQQGRRLNQTKTRAKSGCLTCRRRRKKCDERKPTCSNCVKWHVPCNWPSFHVIEASSTATQDLFRPRKARKPQKQPSSVAGRSHTWTDSPESFDSPACVEHTISGILPAATTTLYPKDQSLSWLLLEYFVCEGSKGMSGRVPADDPFVRLVLQLSQSDKLIWSAVLALSGSRMSIVCPLPAFEDATLYHYSDTLVQLQEALGHGQWPPHTGEEMIRLLAASILLCHEESLLGNPRNSLQSHLRATRELVKIAQDHPSKQHYSEVYAVLFEVYTYYSTMMTFQHAASRCDIQANIDSLQFYRSLTRSSTFGYIMVAACDLFTLMPYVALFGLLIRTLGQTAHSCLEVELMYRRLAAKILCWQDDGSARLPEEVVKVTLIYQNALLMFLHASYLCQETDRSTLESTLKPIVADTLTLYESIRDMPVSVTTFWPMVIVGSCLFEQQDKDRLLSYVMSGRLTSGIQARASVALLWMWERQDEEGLFGPVGLERFTQENDTGLCIG